MTRKLDGSFIESGTITVTQLSGTLNETSNAAYIQANAAYAQANAARSDANTTFATVNSTFGTVNTSLGTVNTTFGTVNTAVTTAHNQANAAYGAANTRLSTSGGSISGDLAITGNLTVTGNATTINVSNLSVNDSMILLSTNAVGDSNDIGFIGHFDRGATATHAGLIRKATENRFYLFDNYEVEPTNNVINVAGNNFRVGNLRLGIINANSFVTSAGLDVTGQANAAYGAANTAQTNALNAYGQANASGTFALSAYGQANAAYGAANNRVLKSGDTITGQITGGLSGGGQAIDLATNDNYASFRVFRNAKAGGDGLFIGYGNNNSGLTRIYGGGATSGEFIKYSNYSYDPGSFRSPIFYDSDNTAYYCDPNAQSYQYRLKLANYAGSVSSGAVVSFEIQNNGGTGDANVAAMAFHCSGTYATHMHLRADGYFGMGGWSASTWRWYVNMTNGDFTAAGNVTAYSDPRLKTNIRKIDSALDKVVSLNGVKFQWIESSVIGNPGKEDYGILSNEVAEIAPELVVDSIFESEDGDKYKTVAYDKLVPFLIEAIKELKAEIDELKKNN